MTDLDQFSRFDLPYFSFATFTAADTQLLGNGHSRDGVPMLERT